MNHKNNKAFTLVELLLAMTILTILLTAIVTLVIQMGRIYSKGVTSKSLNQVATVLSKDLQSSINQAKAGAIKTVMNADKTGRVCTGSVSYVWNTVASRSTNRYTTAGPEIVFARANDPGAGLCKTPGSPVNRAEAHEMLPQGQNNFMIYRFYVGSDPSTPVPLLYWVHMELGSSEDDEMSRTPDGKQTCYTGKDGRGNFCAENVFEFTARAGNATM